MSNIIGFLLAISVFSLGISITAEIFKRNYASNLWGRVKETMVGTVGTFLFLLVLIIEMWAGVLAVNYLMKLTGVL